MLVAIPCSVHKIVRGKIESFKDAEGKVQAEVQRTWNTLTYQLLVDLPERPSELNNVVIMENAENGEPLAHPLIESAARSRANIVIWAEINPDRRPDRRGELNTRILEVEPAFDSKPADRPANATAPKAENGKA